MKRPICAVCNQRSCAVNYHRDEVVHYRTRCDNCIRKDRKMKPHEPRWKTGGYKKKPTCDLCGFKGRYNSQTLVYHLDGDLNNVESRNLRTICRNCVEVVKRQDLSWQQGDLAPDF